jgi:hypothetical protein
LIQGIVAGLSCDDREDDSGRPASFLGAVLPSWHACTEPFRLAPVFLFGSFVESGGLDASEDRR